MNFRTEFKLEPFKRKITYKDKIFLLGSCFAQNMSNYFSQSRFQTVTNPFGIVYHPLAIERIVNIAVDDTYNPEELSFEYQEIWSNFDAHSLLSSVSKQRLIENLKVSKRETEKALINSNIIFITLGTAWVYEHIDLDRVVANCHKLPQRIFKKRILELSIVKAALENIIQKIHKINPDAEIIYTLSPVRHLKDGFIENQLSKSTLYLAVQESVNTYDKVSYFPSYELLLDDLRDYRFYDRDMVHPNNIALDYLWAKLKESMFSDETKTILKKVENINSRLEHRFFNSNSKASLLFKEQTSQLINDFTEKYPYIKF